MFGMVDDASYECEVTLLKLFRATFENIRVSSLPKAVKIINE